MSQTHRIGMVGLDTSHVEAFAKLLMDPSDPHYIPGCEIVAAYPGGSPDFDLSIDRVEGFTRMLAEQYNVPIVDSPEAVAEESDLVFIHSVDGRIHREQFERIAKYGRPTFIDKPFTVSTEDARAILDTAEDAGIPVMSCSSVRYAEQFTEAFRDDSNGAIISVDVWGPLNLVDTQPGYFWYGVHAFEVVVAALGVGCQHIEVSQLDQGEIVSMQWNGGRTGIYHGLRTGGKFGVVIHRENGVQMVDISKTKRPYYASLIDAILRSLPNGKSDISSEEMYEVVRVIELANELRDGKFAGVIQKKG